MHSMTYSGTLITYPRACDSAIVIQWWFTDVQSLGLPTAKHCPSFSSEEVSKRLGSCKQTQGADSAAFVRAYVVVCRPKEVEGRNFFLLLDLPLYNLIFRASDLSAEQLNKCVFLMAVGCAITAGAYFVEPRGLFRYTDRGVLENERGKIEIGVERLHRRMDRRSVCRSSSQMFSSCPCMEKHNQTSLV